MNVHQDHGSFRPKMRCRAGVHPVAAPAPAEAPWLTPGQLRHLRARFLGLARQARRTDYPMFAPYLRIAQDYRNQLRNLKTGKQN